MADRRLDVDLLARELGNWRTANGSGPVYQGLADGLRMLIVDGRLPVGSRLPSERALADALRVSRTTVTTAYAQMRDEGYLTARRGARSTTALPETTGTPPGPDRTAPTTINLAAAALSAPASAVLDAFGDDADILTVRENGRPVASVLSLYWRGTVMPYWGGGIWQARALRANDFNLSASRYRPMSQVRAMHQDPRALLAELAAIEVEIAEEVEALRSALSEAP